jgi:two-component system response regulator YcbB
MRYYLIEDDAATRRMLELIITSEGLGTIVGTSRDGSEVSLDEVREADIVLIDLLMPGRDGIETIRALREEGYDGRFVMISQVENKEMVAEAYLSGVDTYIHKPVNRLEVLSVLRRVAKHRQLEQSLTSIRRSLSALDTAAAAGRPSAAKSFESHVGDLLSRLGISGEAGASDLSRILSYLHRLESAGNHLHRELPTLKELYQSVLAADNPNLSGEQLQREIKAMEQRLRRAILQALGHMASIGLTDYANPTFEHYAPRLFDFQEVRLRMTEIQNGERTTKCRLSIKKFISALYAEIQAQLEA